MFSILILFLPLIFASKPIKNDDDFVFLTFFNGTDAQLEVNLVVADSAKSEKQIQLISQLAVKNANQTKTKMERAFDVRQQSPSDSMFGNLVSSSDVELPLLIGKTANVSKKDGSVGQ